MSSTPQYRNVRALKRGLDVLQALNRFGHARVAELAAAAAIDRTTAYRMLTTLADYGLVRENPSTHSYVLTEMVRRLSDGFTERDRTTQIVSAPLGRLFHKVLWPTDFATFDQGAMVIRETTHRFSPYSVHRNMIGRPRDMMTSALGRAALAGARPDDRESILEIVRGLQPHGAVSPSAFKAQVDQILSDYERYGYSSSPVQGRTRAIGVAVRTGSHAAAAVNLVFFASAMSVATAAERYLEPLQDCVAEIESALAREACADGEAVGDAAETRPRTASGSPG